MKGTRVLWVGPLVVAACAPTSRILIGNVLTGDARSPRAEAVAIRGSRIVAVGRLAEVRAAAGAAREERLDGQTILPGLVDAHGHLHGLGQRILSFDLRRSRSYAEVISAAVRRAERLAAGEWVLGRGWDETRWSSKRLPTHQALSRALPDRPVLLRRVDGHAALANAAALRKAGIDRRTPDPPGGRIVRDAKGEPTGVLIDRALGLVRPPKPSASLIAARLEAAAKHCARHGLTQVHDMGMSAEVLRALRDLARRGRLPIRVVAYLAASNPQEVSTILRRFRAETPTEGWRVLVRGIKLVADGAMGSRGAALLEPYADAPANRGLLMWRPRALGRAMQAIGKAGLQPAVHAIGDRAVRAVIAGVARWPHALRPRIEHLQLLPPEGTRRLAATRLVASMQPTHAVSDMRWAEKRLGVERVRRAYAWQDVIAAGVPLAFGSDFPVEAVNPFTGIQAAVTRQDAKGKPPGGWFTRQRLSFAAALRAFSLGAANAAKLPLLGKIAPGYAADLTVVDGDPSKMSPARLRSIRVRRTFVAGKVAYVRR